MRMTVDYDRWRLTWQSRMHGRVEEEVSTVDEWSDINGASKYVPRAT